MTARVLGIDPGLTGAWAMLEEDGSLLAVEDLPVIRDGRLAWIDADALLSRLLEARGGRPMRAIVERVHAMPRNGSQAAFSQGATLGSILATLQLVRASIELVQPATWKRAAGLSGAKDATDRERKSASLDRARLLFPDAPLDRVKDHGRAESLLIAHHGIRATSIRRAA